MSWRVSSKGSVESKLPAQSSRPRRVGRTRVRNLPLTENARVRVASARGRRTRVVMLVMLVMAGFGVGAGWRVEKTVYGPARAQVDGVLSTRPHLLNAPIAIYTPTPSLS